jgi:tRNA-specific 2-thiouridylase
VKIAIAMSGGVDSSVAAALLKQAGHDVIGVTMLLSANNSGAADAREVAGRLDITHHTIDLRDEFARRVIAPFCEEYARGRTPNPCVVCNREIKFGLLREKAAALGADHIATGHYAQVERNESTHEYRLKKGADARKDQSYFLCRLTQDQLAHTMFPVGRLTKPEVRRLAAEMGLPVASRPESQEACFIPGGDYAAFVKDFLRQPSPPGPILDGAGNILGEHRGVVSYTIGQRHGLGIAASFPGRIYVTAIRPERNAVVLGTREETFADDLVAGDLSWIAGQPPEYPVELKARVRYRHPEAAATVMPLEDGTLYVKFAEPQMAVTPGQTIAFYEGDYVIGGGTILRKGR